MNNFSSWLTALMLLLFLSMVAVAFQFPPNARLAPFIVGVPGMLLCVLQLGLYARNVPGGRFAKRRFRPAPKVGNPDSSIAQTPKFGPDTVARELMMWSYFGGFVAALLAFGFYVAVPVLLVLFLHRQAGVALRRAVMAGIGGTAALFYGID